MKQLKTVLLLIVPIIIVILGCLLYIKLQESPYKKIKTYKLYAKLDSLILFDFENKENPLVTNYSFENENDLKTFSDVNFVGMDLKTAIEKYLEIERSNGVTLTNVYLWTNWDNTIYFKDDNYKLNILDENTINQVSEITKPNLLYNQKYYKVGDEHNYNIIVKEDWSLEYHVDEYTATYCDEYMEDACFDTTINDKYYESTAATHTYSLSEGKITIKPKENESYFGWVYAYDDCDIMYNALKCDYYNGYHSENPEYQHTVYYEIR